MKTTVIKVQLSPGSIDNAIKELKKRKAVFENKKNLFLKRLADIGLDVARAHFEAAAAELAGTPASVNVEVTTNGTGYSIVASGEQIAFLEFGAGITSGQGYKGKRPEGISNIGQFGKGKGSRDSWMFYDKGDKDSLVTTSGNPPAMGMYYASKEMKENIVKIAREVFIND